MNNGSEIHFTQYLLFRNIYYLEIKKDRSRARKKIIKRVKMEQEQDQDQGRADRRGFRKYLNMWTHSIFGGVNKDNLSCCSATPPTQMKRPLNEHTVHHTIHKIQIHLILTMKNDSDITNKINCHFYLCYICSVPSSGRI